HVQSGRPGRRLLPKPARMPVVLTTPMELDHAESSVVFTVKLPESLAGQIRARAHESDRAISAVVAQALAEFLQRDAPEGRPGR
ncbi:hypothetical protein, partial [Streptomyces sp. AS58]|uniref:hypothetical protein n=1 Tax=Streptomyces sp. AS58 TaxID=1519489 RepID=UPI001F16EF29